MSTVTPLVRLVPRTNPQQTNSQSDSYTGVILQLVEHCETGLGHFS